MIASVHLENRKSPLTINLLSQRLPQLTLGQVFDVGPFQSHVLEAVFADPEFGLFSVLFRVGREVPDVYLVFADVDLVDVFDFREGLVLLFEGRRSGIHLCVALQRERRETVAVFGSKMHPGALTWGNFINHSTCVCDLGFSPKNGWWLKSKVCFTHSHAWQVGLGSLPVYMDPTGCYHEFLLHVHFCIRLGRCTCRAGVKAVCF